MNSEEDRPVFRGSHIAESMRHNGYRNTALALAEIIDNAVEADAKHIEILCSQKQNYGSDRSTKQIDEIAVFDDGCGMDHDTLWNSLLMGEGTRHQAKGIGKFGMGLPNSSISQCRNVTVYSWTTPNNVISAYINLDENSASGILSVKKPKITTMLKMWKNKSKYMKNAQSGTLVVWSELDRIQWRRASALIKNSERIIGRTYRKFLQKNTIDISFVVFDNETNKIESITQILPNDPLYMMVPSNTPSPWNNKAMFEKDGDSLEETKTVGGHDVIIRCTLATKEAREPQNGRDAGHLPHGKHANFNLGISLVRAHREIYVDTNLCQTYDPRERWWGIEIEFPNELDDVFGVANTKQDVIHFSSMAQEIASKIRGEDSDDNADDAESLKDLRKLVEHIHARIRSMRRTLKNTNVGERTPEGEEEDHDPWPDPDPSPTVTGQQITTMSDKEKEQAIIDALSRIYDPETASIEARKILDLKLRTTFKTADLESPNFFDVSLKGGVTMITLNQDHPAHKHLVEILEDIPNDLDVATANKISKIKAAITLIFVSWAYFENHTTNDEERMKLQSVRFRWSEKLSDLMKTLDD